MSCPYANQQPMMRGGAGAAEYVQSVAGGPGQQSAVSQIDNTIRLRGGRRSRRRSVLSRVMHIVKRRSQRTRRGVSQKRHRRRTYRK